MMKRKFLCLLLALCMMLGLAANVSAEQETITSGDWTYRVYGDEAVLCSYIGDDTEVTVPATIDGLCVTELGWGLGSCFSAVADTMTSVTIEDGIPLINNAAFKNCTALTVVSIPASVTTLGFSAFEGCTSLSEVIFSEGLKSIGRYAFLNTALTSVTLPASVTSIDDYALGYSGEWGDVERDDYFAIFGWSGTYACEYAQDWHYTFYRLDGMTDTSGHCGDYSTWRFEASTGSLYIDSIGSEDGGCDTDPYYNAVQPWIAYADSIERVVVGEGITDLGDGFMADHYPNLTEVILPESLLGIGNSCFHNCTGLTSINLPEDCHYFGGRAFQNTALRSITLSNTSSHIAGYAFADCPDLENVYFTGNAWNIVESAFTDCTLNAWYPMDNTTWNADTLAQYGGNITWNAYDPDLFLDVPVDSFYYEPIVWAVENGITNGATETTFDPNGQCQRAQVVTFLWRAAGCPKVKGENPFTDVKETAFYYDAVLWAVKEGITTGTSADTFSPFKTCSRAEVVTFLWRANGKPDANGANPFEDLKEDSFYEEAVLWAVEKGITHGVDDTHFGPTAPCNRAQVVTFLYRAHN